MELMKNVGYERNNAGRGPVRTTFLPQIVDWPDVPVSSCELPELNSRAASDDASKKVNECNCTFLAAYADSMMSKPTPTNSNHEQPIPTQPAELDWLARFNREPEPWNSKDIELILWFESHRERLPCKPFSLFDFAKVSDPQQFYIALERDIQAGSNGPRAVGLKSELVRLRELFDSITIQQLENAP